MAQYEPTTNPMANSHDGMPTGTNISWIDTSGNRKITAKITPLTPPEAPSAR